MVKAFLLFPGQGSQKVGMGQDLAEAFVEAREVFAEMDDALGASLSRVMFEGPADELTLTHNAQPAIVAHSLAVYRVVAAHLDVAGAAGHSVGEYAAYGAVGTLSVGDAVRLVRRRGELMLEAGRARPGTMAAVLGLPTEQVVAVCTSIRSDDNIVVAANMNSPEQSVLSGDIPAVEAAGEACKEAGAKRVVPLTVSGAFHSPLMEGAVAPFQEALGAASFADPSAPVFSSARVEPVTSGEAARNILDRQLAEPVRWTECVQLASDRHPDIPFIEIGPGKVLTGLNRRMIENPASNLGTAAEIQTFLEAN